MFHFYVLMTTIYSHWFYNFIILSLLVFFVILVKMEYLKFSLKSSFSHFVFMHCFSVCETTTIVLTMIFFCCKHNHRIIIRTEKHLFKQFCFKSTKRKKWQTSSNLSWIVKSFPIIKSTNPAKLNIKLALRLLHLYQSPRCECFFSWRQVSNVQSMACVRLFTETNNSNNFLFGPPIGLNRSAVTQYL